MLEHEWRHSVQWAALGPVAFLALYVANYFGSKAVAGSQCWNVFEWSAGFADGGYDDCRGLGRGYARTMNEQPPQPESAAEKAGIVDQQDAVLEKIDKSGHEQGDQWEKDPDVGPMADDPMEGDAPSG